MKGNNLYQKRNTAHSQSGTKPKVIVAMSGGIDSSVAAALLKKAGYPIIGVFMKFWSAPNVSGDSTENRCCSSESENRARRVAQFLGIPFYTFNFKNDFKKKVVIPFLTGFKKGETPNPCVFCNKKIKFGLFLEKAKALGAEYVATGHYARLRRIPLNDKKSKISYQLLKGKDKTKDQSYFLWSLTQKQLKDILFPLGDYTKQEVKQLAQKLGLPTKEFSESQEICFVSTNLSDFLKKNLSPQPGKIIEVNGKVIGEHNGLCLYTIGQRKNIKLPQGPYYVLKKKTERNVLIVTRNKEDLFKKMIRLKSINWISGKPPRFPCRASVKIRYQSPAAPATILKGGTIIFKTAQCAITPGQSAVFYQKDRVLGGGIIKSSGRG